MLGMGWRRQGSSDRRWEILNRDVHKRDTNNRIFELSVSILILVLGRPLEYGAVKRL